MHGKVQGRHAGEGRVGVAAKGRCHGRADGGTYTTRHLKAVMLVREDGVVQHVGRHLAATVVVHSISCCSCLVGVLQVVLHASLMPQESVATRELDGRNVQPIALC